MITEEPFNIDELIGVRPLTYEETMLWFNDKLKKNSEHLLRKIQVYDIEGAERVFSIVKRTMTQINVLNNIELVREKTKDFKKLSIDEIKEIIGDG